MELRLEASWDSGVPRVDERVRQAVEIIRRPPLPVLLRPAYPAIVAGSVATLAKRARRMLELERPRLPSEVSTRLVMRACAHLLGEAPTARHGRQRNKVGTATAPPFD